MGARLLRQSGQREGAGRIVSAHVHSEITPQSHTQIHARPLFTPGQAPPEGRRDPQRRRLTARVDDQGLEFNHERWWSTQSPAGDASPALLRTFPGSPHTLTKTTETATPALKAERPPT